MEIFQSVIENGCTLIEKFLSSILNWYNMFVGYAVGLLGQDPQAWSGSGWNLISTVNDIFIVIGAVLTLIFFLIGFCADSFDIRQDFRIENILRMYIKISVAEFFVVSSISLLGNLFKMGTGVVKKLSGWDISYDLKVVNKVSKILNNPSGNDIGIMGMLLLFLLSVVFLFVVLGSGMVILYVSYIRFFKVLLLVPYGSLANSTIAGNHAISHSAVAFWKFAICTILEVVTIYVALALSSAILSSETINLVSGTTGVFYVAGWMLECVFICMVSVGSIKGASNLTQRVLGL